MAKFEVLCPNGRRVIVNVTPNTKILQVFQSIFVFLPICSPYQILEEACSKQGFLPVSDYEVKHGKRSLDVTLSVQFAGLPNLAKLELVRLTKARAESSIVLALQLSDGRRLQSEFMPSQTLWNVLEHFSGRSENQDNFTTSQSSSEHPVCVYLKDEIVGEYALRQTMLRDLGLTGGRVIIRHLFREVSDQMLFEIMRQVDAEKARQLKLNSAKVASTCNSLPASCPSVPSQPEPSQFGSEITNFSSSSDEPMITDVESENSVTAGWNANRWSTVFHDSVLSEADASAYSDESLPMQDRARFTEFKFPAETKGKDLYHNEMSNVNRNELKACDRETVVYSLDEVLPMVTSEEDIPDDFFDVTEADIRKMWQDLQHKTTKLADQPMMTQSLRQEKLESKMSQYKRVVIRVQFPDRLVVQGLFRTTETVFSLYKFVKQHLEDSNIDFELFTTPPKVILKDMTKNLFEENLAPMSVVYFGASVKKEHYLSDSVLCEISSQQAANRVLVKLSEPQSLTSIPSASYKDGAASSASSRRSASAVPPSTSSKDSHVPKWFKPGNK